MIAVRAGSASRIPAANDSASRVIPLGPRPPWNRFFARPPEAEMQVQPVADEPGEHDRGERGGQAVPRHGADRVADDEVRVGDRDPDPVGDGDLELSARVLGVELHYAGALLLERADQVGRERLDVGERDRAVGGAAVRRRWVVVLGAEGPARWPRKNSTS